MATSSSQKTSSSSDSSKAKQQHLTVPSAIKKSATSPTTSSHNVSSKLAQQKNDADTSKKPQAASHQLSPSSAAGQHKRRLFSPYKLNINTSQASSSKSPELSNSSSNSHNGTSDHSPASVSKTTTMTTTTTTTTTSIAPPTSGSSKSSSTNPQQLQYKLLSKLSGFKSQMPLSAKRDADSPLHKELKSSDDFSSLDDVKSKLGSSPFRPKNDDIKRNDLMKREDSAYCSSTSSTVSSHDVDPNKLITDKSTEDLTGHEEDELTVSKKNLAGQESGSEIAVPVTKASDNDNEDDFNQEDYCEGTMENLKQTLLNLDHSNGGSNATEEEVDEPSQLNKSISKLKNNSNGNQNIQDSIGELNQLMISSSISTTTIDEPAGMPNLAHGRQRRPSTNSLNQMPSNPSPMFKPPSNLPPVENCEVIQIDIETYRLMMQDIQNTKTILYKLASILKEPSSTGAHQQALNNEANGSDVQPDDLLSSFYSHVSV